MTKKILLRCQRESIVFLRCGFTLNFINRVYRSKSGFSTWGIGPFGGPGDHAALTREPLTQELLMITNRLRPADGCSLCEGNTDRKFYS